MAGTEAAAVSAAVSGMLKIVGNKLAPLLIKEYSFIVGVKKDLQEVQGQLVEISNWLETTGHIATGDDPPFNWLKILKDIAYDVDDVVEEFQLKAEKHDANSGIVSKYIYTKPKSFIFQCKAASKIKAIKKRFAAVLKQRSDFNVIANSLPAGLPVRHLNKTTTEMPSLPMVDVASVLGREQEKHQIISKLVDTSDKQEIKIVSVIGLGGSGKTTFAKLFFNDVNIIGKHFEVRLWVYVSQEFSVKRFLEKLYEVITGEKSERCTPQIMCNSISNKLTGKRYLLVLDDVWTEDRTLWEEVMVHLKSGSPGSRILLTTRSRQVAEKLDSTDLFDLPLLSEADGWRVFEQSSGLSAKALELEFVEVGKEIVKNCGGVPLAIKALAGSLHGVERIEEWHAMRDISLLDAEGAEGRVFACLRLSYFHLPSHLKQCFTICSMFPKGHWIDKEQLIDLWIAHNMITLEAGVNYLEYIGHKHFHSLVQISFLQYVEGKYGKVICSMHDLVHDLARKILGDEISLVVPKEMETTSLIKRYRYFSLIEQPENLVPKNIFGKARALYVAEGCEFRFGKALKSAKHLRSVTMEYVGTKSILTATLQIKNLRYLEISELRCEVLPEAISNIWSLQALHVASGQLLELPKSFGKLQKLRTLHLSWCAKLMSLPDSIGDCHMISSLDLSDCRGFEVLPNSIGRNKKLRVLRLNHSSIKRLPSSITTLRNLECLDLRYCFKLVELPEGLGNLEKLEVLNLERCHNLRGMPVGIGQLRLGNMPMFVVGEGKKYAQISELANVGRNTGDVIISGINHVMEPNDAHKACLKKKANLQKLTLYWESRDEADEVNTEMEQEVLDGLEPPSEIKELDLHGYAGGRYALWMLKQVGAGVHGLRQFPCLTVMNLSGFPKLKHLEGLVELPLLEKLHLGWMSTLESISGGPFPSLVELSMDGLPSLGEVHVVAETIFAGEEEEKLQIGTCLLNLQIERCPKLMVKPYLPSSLEHLLLKESNEQLLQLPGQHGQGSSLSTNVAGFLPSFSYSHLKKLKLVEMTSASSGLGSQRGWELLQHMTALESFTIEKCRGLTELPQSMQSLTSLQSLRVEDCSPIRMLPDWLGELRCLQKMTIRICHSLSSLPQSMSRLTCLRKLRIEYCSALHQLPECLGELHSLRELKMTALRSLTCLPQSMCGLASLEVLDIYECPIKSLPLSTHCLIALQTLKIIWCSDLERRFKREKGEDWHLISHIPRVKIGW